MKKTLQYLQTLEKWIIVIAFAIMVLACFIQVVNRNVFRIPDILVLSSATVNTLGLI